MNIGQNRDPMKRLVLSSVAIAGTVACYVTYVIQCHGTVDGMLLAAVIGSIGIMSGINVIEAFKKVK